MISQTSQPRRSLRSSLFHFPTLAPTILGSSFKLLFLAVPHGVWDLSSLTRDGTPALYIESVES